MVHLVGAGPGDPGLLTVRGRELLASCDCVVYDYLVEPAIVALAAPDVVRHYVGKRGGRSSTPQTEITALLIRLAGVHRTIVRLKGGDPLLFGRGGEEAGALASAGIRFTIVPGVTSGIAAPAYAGIPVTHRAHSSAVVFVTGHQQEGCGARTGAFAWSQVAQVETIVLYMGMHRLAENCAAIMRAGRAADTPAAAVQWGTRPEQRTVVGTLATLPALVVAAGLGAPAITVIGEVVTARSHLRWFDDPSLRPLCGRRILVTRAREQASPLAAALRAAGAAVTEAPLARYALPTDLAPLDALIDLTPTQDWLVFTSGNGVRLWWERLRARGRDARAVGAVRLAVVGPATARQMAEYGLHADLVGSSDGAALARDLLAVGGGSAVIPQAGNARPQLAEALRTAGWRVTTALCYVAEDLVPPPPPEEPFAGITLASAATVDRLVSAWGRERMLAMTVAGTRLWAIGPVTAAQIRTHGLPVAAMANEASVSALVAAACADLAPAP
jgi:uroporphyrinogen III methyltransferase/synthase